jgi:hypothetical protein
MSPQHQVRLTDDPAAERSDLRDAVELKGSAAYR